MVYRNGWRKKSREQKVRKHNRYGTFLKKSKQEYIRNDEYWKKTKVILQKLQAELKELGKVPNISQTTKVIEYAIKMFNITSSAQDALDGEVKICPVGNFDKITTLQALRNFNYNLSLAGRHQNVDLTKNDVPHWNITKKGQTITKNNIMFGPEIGYPLRTASYWLGLSKSKKVEFSVQNNYGNNILTKKNTMEIWITDALVRCGIHSFCIKITSALLKNLEILLD